VKVIAFLGSPREGGNTELLLNEALKGSEESGDRADVFALNKMSIMPCQNCGGCDATGLCIYEDDMTLIYEAIRSCDRIILASPIFFSALSAQTKIMIDRCQAFWCEKYLLKKPIPAGPYGRKGLLLMVGGMKKEIGMQGMQCAERSAKAFLRTVNVPDHNTLCYTGVDAKGEIVNHPSALRDAYEAGRALVKF
jgi:multimeric flavodoxin WrbA